MVPGMRTRTSPYAGSRLIRFVAGAALIIGVGAAVAGIAFWVNGLTHVHTEVLVPVELTAPDLDITADPAVRSDGVGLPAGARFEATSPLRLRAWDSTLTEQMLARGDSLLLGLGVGIGGFLLRRLLLSIAEGRPFEPANARRLAVIAGLIGVIGTLSGLLPQLAGILVLDRIGQAGPDSPFVLGVHFPLLPLLALPVVLALAEAFRRGAALADDMAGLV
jgi:hypothetical protein